MAVCNTNPLTVEQDSDWQDYNRPARVDRQYFTLHYRSSFTEKVSYFRCVTNGARYFFCAPQGPFVGPCPHAKRHNFSQFDQNKSQLEKSILVFFNNYSVFFHLDVPSFNLKSNDIKLYDYM